MSKIKKTKQNPAKLSPEGYIRKKARSLPIYECLINTEWNESGMAQILVTRNHVNGNFTLGFYLVDLYCLGVKDTFYQFNISLVEYDELKLKYLSDLETEECNYLLAHNIIYGAIAFAEDFGFQPHKDFKITTQYILEEDTEDVELIEVEFGLNGKPCAVSSPYTDIDPIIAQLEKTAGPGNFEVINLDIDGNTAGRRYVDFDDEVGDESADIEEADSETEKSIEEISEMTKWSRQQWQDFFDGKTEISKHTIYLLVDSIFYSMFEEDEVDKTEDEIAKMLTFHITYEPFYTIHPYSDYYSERNLKESVELIDEVAEQGNYSQAIKMTYNLIKMHPKNPVLYLNLINYYGMNNNSRKSDDITIYTWQKFPENLFVKLFYGNYLLENNKITEFEKVLENKWELTGHFPDRDTFHISEVMSFYSLVVHYFLAIDETLKADLLFKEIMEFDDDQQQYDDLSAKITMAKFDILEALKEDDQKTVDKIKSHMRIVD